MNYFIFDIETSAKPQDQLKLPEFEASKVLKDPEKIKADIEKKKAEWIDECALYADRGYILAIGLMKNDGTIVTLHGIAESELIQGFWGAYKADDGMILGHCIKSFDLPFIIRRSWMNGIAVPPSIFRGRYFNERIFDTMEQWACGNYQERISLDNLAKAFGLPGKNGNGKDFASQYLAGGESKQKAIEYLLNDLRMTQTVAEAMGIIS